MTPPDPPPVDAERVEAFAGRLIDVYSGSMLSFMIDLGDRTGLFTALAAGPATSVEVAARAGLTERYVREWLAAVAAGRLVDYDATNATFALPPEAAALLTPGPMNLAPYAQLNTHVGKHVHQVARAFREGGGVPYAEYRPEFTDVMDAISRIVFDHSMVDAYVPMIDGLTAKLEAGARVADVACGTGHSLIVLARAFPASTFVGFDLDDAALARGRAEANGAGLGNVTFVACDAATLRVDEPFDAVFVFDAIHDQVDPSGVLRSIHDSLRPGGTLFDKEPKAADRLEDNLQNPMAAVLYGVSTLHCLTVSLAHDGAGIGTMFGGEHARRLLRGAGFVDVETRDDPADPFGAIHLGRRAS